MPNFWLELFRSSIARYSTRVLGAALARARRMGVADLSDACGDWMTVGLQWVRCRRPMSPIGDLF